MGDLLYGLSWILDAATLDLRRKSLPALIGNSVAWGLFGLLFTILPISTVSLPITFSNALARLVVFVIGAGLLARIVQGRMFYWRYTRTGRPPPSEMVSQS